MGSERARIAPLRFVNRWFWLGARLLLARPFQLLFRLEVVNADCIPRKGAAFVLPNHVNLLDPIWLYSCMRRPIYLVATEEIFRSWFLRMLVRWFGAFPKRKAAHDLYTVKTMFSVIRSGGLIGVYPEGSRTWDGTNAAVVPTIARVIRKFGVPVITCRFDGGYLAWPRWASRYRRTQVRIVFEPLYEAGTLPVADEQMIRDIQERIRIRDYEIGPGRLTGSQGGLTQGISRLLYRCPTCGALETLKPVGPWRRNNFECGSCSCRWKLDLRCRVAPMDADGRILGECVPLNKVYREVRAMPLTPVACGVPGIQAGEDLYLISRPHLVFREVRFPYFRPFAYGRLMLTSRRLIVHGIRGLRLSVPVGDIESLSIEPGDKLHFVYRGRLYRVVFRSTSALKWADFIERIVGRDLTALG
jgi:1-acyl-sn-glycerol-3-phosphate acyltransferase